MSQSRIEHIYPKRDLSIQVTLNVDHKPQNPVQISSAVEGDLNGLRIGTPELVRWGIGVKDVPEITSLVIRALRMEAPENLAQEVAKLRKTFHKVHFICK